MPKIPKPLFEFEIKENEQRDIEETIELSLCRMPQQIWPDPHK